MQINVAKKTKIILFELIQRLGFAIPLQLNKSAVLSTKNSASKNKIFERIQDLDKHFYLQLKSGEKFCPQKIVLRHNFYKMYAYCYC